MKNRKSISTCIALALALSLPALLVKSSPHHVGASNRMEAGTNSIALSSPRATAGDEALRQLNEQGASASLEQAIAAARYAVRPASSSAGESTVAYAAQNHASRFSVSFTQTELKLASVNASCSAPAPWQASMKLTGVGYGDRIERLGAADIRARGNRVEYHRKTAGLTAVALTEWYVNKSEGLEQGFTISEPPGSNSAGNPLRIEMQLGGDLRAVQDGRDIQMMRADGTAALKYGGLYVTDATNRELPARMIAAGGRVFLEADDAGATYPVVVDPIFSEQQKLIASDRAPGDNLGQAIAIIGDTVVVGAPYDNVGANADQGSAYVFVRNAGVWTQQAMLTAGADPAASADDHFGQSVTISGNTVVVGSPGSDISGRLMQGAAYVFTRSGVVWTQEQKIVAADGLGDDNFGQSVALNADTVAIGAYRDDLESMTNTGSAYIFFRVGTTWSQQAKLLPSETKPEMGFGYAAAISGETVVIGAYLEDFGLATDVGGAYVFVRTIVDNVPEWNEEDILLAPDGEEGDHFGLGVAINGNSIFVGAPNEDGKQQPDQGAVYWYARSVNQWFFQQKIVANDGLAHDLFGRGIAADFSKLLIGAEGADIAGNLDQGAAYIFRPIGGSWVQEQKLTASDGAPSDFFGHSVGLSDVTLAIGARGDDSDSGAAYIFFEGCDAVISPTSRAFTRNGGPGSFSVTILPHCMWTATSNAPWITVNPPTSGMGNGTISYTVAASPDPNTRTGTISVNEETYTVIQMGLPSVIKFSLADIDGDGKSDFGFYRDGTWGFLQSTMGYGFCCARFFGWGGMDMQPLTADFDGDGKDDLAFVIPPPSPTSFAQLAVLRSTTNYDNTMGVFFFAGFPSLGDTPALGDFDGDGLADPGLWRESDGSWSIPTSSSGYTNFIFASWGQMGDFPIVGDYDNDGKDDIGYYRNGLWAILKSSSNYNTADALFFTWGGQGLQPIVADFDGDHKADIAYIVPPTNGQSAAYAIRESGQNYSIIKAVFVPAGFPVLGDTPVVGDWDGDGKGDPGIWRESNGNWIIPTSSSKYLQFIFTQWGVPGDIAIPNTIGKH